VQDITVHKETQLSNVRLNNLYTASSQINAAIMRIRDRTELFQEVCRIAVMYGRFHLVWVLLFLA